MPPVVDPVRQLAHDHVHLNRVVDATREAVQQALRGEMDTEELTDALREFLDLVAEEMYEHFELEETQLFPYVLELFPDKQPVVERLEQAHDRMCGVCSRIERLVEAGPRHIEQNYDTLVSLFARFDANYIKHAGDEHALIDDLAARLGPEERARAPALLAEIG